MKVPQRARRRLALASLLSLTSLAACGDQAKPATTPAAPPPAASATAAPAPPPDAGTAAAPLPPGVPDSPAGHQLAWVLGAFAQPPSEADATPHFAPSFNEKIPVGQTVQVLTQIGAQLSPLAIDRVEVGASPDELEAVVHSEKPGSASDTPRVRIQLAVDATDLHQIATLMLAPVIEAKVAASWDEVQSGLRAVAPSVAFLAAEVGGGKCVSISSIEPKKPLALGSAFKLYILNALAKQVAAGKHKWDDTIAIEESKKSLATPGGHDMQREPAGKTFTVRELAENMISVSDNTATDHLLAFVGRSAVEDAAKASGHATPARLVPFLSTRELFALKLTGSPEELKGYVAADVAHKRKILETFDQRDLSAVPFTEHGWPKPRMIDSIEWFASPEDLCKLMVSLKAQADATPTAPVGAILSKNPGLTDDKKLYKYIAFKGGSEPGVLNMTWLMQRKIDDKWVFLTVGFNDSGNLIDDMKAVLAVSTARDFLGR